MSVKIITRKLEARELSIKLADGSVVKGKINLHHDEPFPVFVCRTA